MNKARIARTPEQLTSQEQAYILRQYRLQCAKAACYVRSGKNPAFWGRWSAWVQKRITVLTHAIPRSIDANHPMWIKQ